MENNETIQRIFDAVKKVTGVDRSTVTSGSRVREHYFARMIVAYHLKDAGFSNNIICAQIKVTKVAVTYQIKGYMREWTPYFRRCAKEVKDLLTQNTIKS